MTIDSRIREMKRLMLHQRDSRTRAIWESHIKFLKAQLNTREEY